MAGGKAARGAGAAVGAPLRGCGRVVGVLQPAFAGGGVLCGGMAMCPPVYSVLFDTPYV